MSSYLRNQQKQQNSSSLLRTPPSKRIYTPAGDRLDTIVEGKPPGSRGSNRNIHSQHSIHAATTPHSPPDNSPWLQRFNPPLASDEKSPPSYRSQHSSENVAADRFAPRSPLERDNPTWFERLKRRGGWRRLLLIILIGAAVLVALAVGLGVGLAMGLKKKSQSGDNAPASSGQDEAQPFPIGNWNFPVALTSTSTECTANPSTWRCPPYSTYSQAQTASQTSFSFIITSNSADASNSSLQIASASNPFSLLFPNTSLALFDPGRPKERYTFDVKTQKQVTPDQSLTPDGKLATCFFNETVITATLYTQVQHSGSEARSALPGGPMVNGGAQPWPGTVYVSQSSGGGSDVPACYPAGGGGAIAGPRIRQGLEAQAAGRQCSCVWNSVNVTMTTNGNLPNFSG